MDGRKCLFQENSIGRVHGSISSDARKEREEVNSAAYCNSR